MKGMLLDFAGSSNIEEAVTEYEILHSLTAKWHSKASARTAMARLVEVGKGIPAELTLDYLTDKHGAAPWSLEKLEKEPKEPKLSKEPKEPKEDRWPEIREKAKDLVKSQPDMVGDELTNALDSSMDTDLSELETDRAKELVSPERRKKLVGPPERTPKDERTPETSEIIDQKWPEIQEKRILEKEKKKERTPPGKALFGPQAVKKSYADPQSFLAEEYPELAGGDGFRAFLEAAALLRSGCDDRCVADTVDAEYAGIDANTVLSAAKAFIKGGKSDPYINGGILARKLVKQAATKERVKTVLSHLLAAQMNEHYIDGFHAVITSVNLSTQ